MGVIDAWGLDSTALTVAGQGRGGIPAASRTPPAGGDHKRLPPHCHAKKAFPRTTASRVGRAGRRPRTAGAAGSGSGASKVLHGVKQVRKTGAVQSAFPFPVRPARATPSRRFLPFPGSFGPVLLAAALIVAGLAACATSSSRREKFLERVPPPQPLLTGTATYGNGLLAVQAWLGPSVRLKKPEEEQSGARGRRGGDQREYFNGSLRSGETEGYDRFADPFQDDAEHADRYTAQEVDEMYGRVNYQYILPPRLALTFMFANTGTQPMMVSVTEVNSTLGNFAPRPERLLLKPGQQGSLDPMLSTLIDNFDHLDVTLAVKIGERRETQVLRLRRTEEPHPAGAAK